MGSLLMVYFIVFILQSIFNVLKVLEIKYSVTNRTKPLLINSVLISSLTIVVSFYSLEELFSGNWKIIFSYVSGSVVGKWFVLKYEHKFIK